MMSKWMKYILIKKGKRKLKVDAYPFADKQYTKEEVEAMIIADDIKRKSKKISGF